MSATCMTLRYGECHLRHRAFHRSSGKPTRCTPFIEIPFFASLTDLSSLGSPVSAGHLAFSPPPRFSGLTFLSIIRRGSPLTRLLECLDVGWAVHVRVSGRR